MREKIIYNLAMVYEKQLKYEKAFENYEKCSNSAANRAIALFKIDPALKYSQAIDLIGEIPATKET